MTVSAQVIADSISPQGIRLTTMQVTMHRFVLAEFNTHRVFSRNFRSSRAVPVKKLLEEVRTNPAMPVYWGKNQSGMQAAEELSYDDMLKARYYWRDAADKAASSVERLADYGLHKQIANRLLEPFLYVHGVVTSTEWDNFFGLRLHKDAQPEMRALAEAMWKARQESTPIALRPGLWHLPYVGREMAMNIWDEVENAGHGEAPFPLETLKKMSVARCARVSYKSFDTDKPSTVEEDLKLYDRLLGAQPFHASPAEHQATPDNWRLVRGALGEIPQWEHQHEWGNFHNWRQYRKMLPGEAVAPLPEGYGP